MDDNKLKSLVEESVQEASNSFAKDIAELRSMLMEVMGRTATIAFKNPNPTMEVTSAMVHRHRPEIGRFCGENPEASIFQVERYLEFYKTSYSEQLTSHPFTSMERHLNGTVGSYGINNWWTGNTLQRRSKFILTKRIGIGRW